MSSEKKIIKTFAAIASVLMMLSCSSFQETPSQIGTVIEKSTGETVIPRNSNSLYIYPIKNKTPRQEIENKLMIKIRSALALEGRLAIVSDIKNAELTLECMINNYIIEIVEFGNFGRPVKMRLKIFLSSRLVDVKKGRVIFSDPEMQSYKIYSDSIPPVETEEQAQDYVIDNLGNRIKEKTMTGWDTKYRFPEEMN